MCCVLVKHVLVTIGIAVRAPEPILSGFEATLDPIFLLTSGRLKSTTNTIGNDMFYFIPVWALALESFG